MSIINAHPCLCTLYICIHKYMCVCMNICSICTYICVSAYNIHTYIHKDIQWYLHTWMDIQMHMSTLYIPKCKHSYSIYTYTYMHAYTHALKHMFVCNMCIYFYVCSHTCECKSAYIHVKIFTQYVHLLKQCASTWKLHTGN